LEYECVLYLGNVFEFANMAACGLWVEFWPGILRKDNIPGDTAVSPLELAKPEAALGRRKKSAKYMYSK
jgi:hypothetical protein